MISALDLLQCGYKVEFHVIIHVNTSGLAQPVLPIHTHNSIPLRGMTVDKINKWYLPNVCAFQAIPWANYLILCKYLDTPCILMINWLSVCRSSFGHLPFPPLRAVLLFAEHKLLYYY